jgi:glycosidase
MSRFYTQVNEDMDLFKLGLAYILTVRGIPQIYYGTEILMANPDTGDHGIIRSDFPGGWSGDEVNGFTDEELSASQLEARDYLSTILKWRKDQKTIHEGKLKHYVPENGIYVFFRYTDDDKVMVVLSKRAEDYNLDLTRFAEMVSGGEEGVDIISGEPVQLDGSLQVPARRAMIIDFK